MGGFAGAPDGHGLLERSAELAALTRAFAGVEADGQGRIALVAGEAGIGKTALLRQFATATASGGTEGTGTARRVLWTRCEPLFTPRPLGPVLELADAIGSQAAARAVGVATPYDVGTALLRELAAPPSVLVVEDVHWADAATLDVVLLFGRRVADVPLLLVLSYRDNELDRAHPLRLVLGSLPGSDRVVRLELAALSPSAVWKLAAPARVDAAELYRWTAGNPFYVTEVLAAGRATVPGSVRDAVLARAAALPRGARDLLDEASVVPGAIEEWQVDALASTAAEALDECVAAGMLVHAGGRVEFRHEIARQAIEESLPERRRRALHREALALLAARPAGQQDLARLAHHADAADDAEALVRYGPAAAAQAAGAGAYREATRLYGRALRFPDLLTPGRHAAMLEEFAAAAYFTEHGREATEALRTAVAIHASRADALRQGDALRQLGKQLGRDGALAESKAAISEAVILLEGQPPGRELACAYNAMAAVTGMADDDDAVLWGKKAMQIAEQAGCMDAMGDTLSILGTAELRLGNLPGLEKLERSGELARLAGDVPGMAQALLRPAIALAGRREWALAEPYIRQGRDFTRDRGLLPLYGWLTTFAAEEALARNRWDEAVRISAEILGWPAAGFPTLRITALLITGAVHARRGQPGCEPLLAEAVAISQRIPPARHVIQIAALRAELAWLAGKTPPQIADAADAGMTASTATRWFGGETEAWQHRAGRFSGDPARLPEPYALEIGGDVEAAARWWQQRGCAYDAAVALACSADRVLMRRALDLLLGIGARPAAAAVGRRLRDLGELGLPHGPRPATAANAAGLTTRETEVLALVAAGLSNTEIAVRLVLSGRTVENHVAAIFRKLGVHSREAARAAAAGSGQSAQDQIHDHPERSVFFAPPTHVPGPGAT
jgi:DNA-binding CsgD family transcriptional regulator